MHGKMFEDPIQHLIGAWKKAFGQEKDRKEEAEEPVVRWEWTTGERYSPLPFHFARFPGRGRVLKAEPAQVGYFLLVGFDHQDQVRVQRSIAIRKRKQANLLQRWLPGPDLSKKVYKETFTRYSPDRIESIAYSVSPQRPIPLEIREIFFEDGRVTFACSLRVNGYTPLYSQKGKDPEAFFDWLGPHGRFLTAEEYHYAGTRLERIVGYYEAPGAGSYSTREQFSYDEAGNLLRIERFFADGKKLAVYQKRKKGQTFQAMREEATQRLVEAVIQRVTVAQIQEEVYGIQLNYQRVTDYFPPSIIIMPETYRKKILLSPDPNARLGIFFPHFEPEWFLPLEDPEILEMCQLLEQEIQAGEKWDTATAILRDVAAVLTRQDWSGGLHVTPDFVVFALDPEMEGDRLVEVLSSSASIAQVQDWIQKGWL
jgi:hypothetical protein